MAYLTNHADDPRDASSADRQISQTHGLQVIHRIDAGQWFSKHCAGNHHQGSDQHVRTTPGDALIQSVMECFQTTDIQQQRHDGAQTLVFQGLGSDLR